MSKDQSPIAGKADEGKQYQASGTLQPDSSTRAPIGCEAMTFGEIDAVSLAMRQLYQSPTTAAPGIRSP